MNHSVALGEWLGRIVKVITVTSQPPFRIDGIGTSVVLLVLKSKISDEVLRLLVKALVRQQPLAVVTNGIGARAAFDALIDELSGDSRHRHVMTNVLDGSDLHEAIDILLESTWPSEERFDEWAGYAVVAVGGASADIETAIKARLSTAASEHL